MGKYVLKIHSTILEIIDDLRSHMRHTRSQVFSGPGLVIIIFALVISKASAGTWGAGSFENDTAADWAYEFEEHASMKVLSDIFDNIPDQEFIPADTCAIAVAAADITASLKDGTTNHLAEGIKGWIKVNRPNLEALTAAKAINALMTCLDVSRSELAQLWGEQPSEPWQSEIRALENRLR